jgi:zinc protease
VAVQIWVGVGSIHEDEYLGGGISHAIEHMIFKGTEKRGMTDITRDINDAGGDINAYTSFDRTVFHVQMPADKWKVGLDVLSDAVMNARFPEAEWIKEREVIIREMAMGKDDPERVMDKLLWSTAFSVHPYKYPVIGYEDIFRGITRQHLVDFSRKNYVSDNMITVIVGDVDPATVQAGLREVFAGFKRKPRSPVVLPAEPTQLAPRDVVSTGHYNVARIELGYHTVALDHPDAPALDVLSCVVGSGNSSRLVRKIKDELKLVVAINAGSYTPKEPGVFVISAVFNPARQAEVVEAVETEVQSWISGGFTDAEVEKARRMLLISELSQLQNMSGQAGSYASGEFYARDPRFSETYLQRVAQVTPAVLKHVATRYLASSGRTRVILTPADNGAKKSPAAVVARPLVVKQTLDNGIRLVVREDTRLPFVSVCVAFRGGVLSETPELAGSAKLMADLLIKGTARRTAAQIAEISESLGVEIGPFSGYDTFGIKGRCMSPDAAVLFDLLSDCILNPAFPEDEFKTQQTVQLAEIDRAHEEPLFLAQEALRGKLFGTHPYSWTASGRRESVEKLGRNDVMTMHALQVLSSNMVISVFGDIRPEEARRLIETQFVAIKTGDFVPSATTVVPPALPVRTERREPKEQAIVLIGVPGVDAKDSRRDPLMVLETAMSGLSSELGVEVREKRGLAYYVGAYEQVGSQPGAFVVYAGTALDKAAEVEKVMFEEIKRVTSVGIKADEFERARSQIIGDYEMSLQDDSGVAQRCAINELIGLGYDYLFGTRKRMEAVTREQVTGAAASLLSKKKAVVSIVLPDTARAQTEDVEKGDK